MEVATLVSKFFYNNSGTVSFSTIYTVATIETASDMNMITIELRLVF